MADGMCKAGLHPYDGPGRCQPCRRASNLRAVFVYENTPRGALSKLLRNDRHNALRRLSRATALTGGTA